MKQSAGFFLVKHTKVDFEQIEAKMNAQNDANDNGWSLVYLLKSLNLVSTQATIIILTCIRMKLYLYT